MAKLCLFCNEPLPMTRRIVGKGIHKACEKEQLLHLKSYETVLMRSLDNLQLTDNLNVEAKQLIELGKFRKAQFDTAHLRVYTAIKDKLLSDGEFPESEHRFLNQLQSYMQLSDKEAQTDKLNHLRSLAIIAEGNIPHIETSVRLKKGEIAHYEGAVSWKHLKTRKKRVAGSRGQSVRIAKGVSFKVGATRGRTEEWQEFQLVDKGRVVVTSKRLLFIGRQKNLTVSLSRILDIELFTDAVKIHRGTVNPTFFFMDDPSLFFTVLSVVLEMEGFE